MSKTKKIGKRGAKLAQGLGWCSQCGKFLPLENFSKANGSKYGYFYCCKRCNSELRSRKQYNRIVKKKTRRILKVYYRQLLGGKCAKCGYDKAPFALDWHHVEPEHKQNHMPYIIDAAVGNQDRIIKELDKTILLCANCHREFEAGVWTAEFIKNPGLGWSVQLETIQETTEELWPEIPHKYKFKQLSLFESERLNDETR
jgi:hypothetical protein